jgi:hypothetical protein
MGGGNDLITLRKLCINTTSKYDNILLLNYVNCNGDDNNKMASISPLERMHEIKDARNQLEYKIVGKFYS